MKLKNKTVYVHDVWDGKVASELSNLALGLKIATADPGYNKKGLFDYIQTYSPLVVIIATPCWHSPLDVLAGQYFTRATVPLLYLVNKKFWQEQIDTNQLDFFVPPSERVLFRSELTGLSVAKALYDSLRI